jgi:hypothetical protein
MYIQSIVQVFKSRGREGWAIQVTRVSMFSSLLQLNRSMPMKEKSLREVNGPIKIICITLVLVHVLVPQQQCKVSTEH